MQPFERMQKVHVWLGTTKKQQGDFDEYFDQDEGVSQFAKDIGEEEYDEDFMGIMEVHEDNLSIEEIISKMAIDNDEYHVIIKICAEKNITTANASFYYTDALIEIHDKKKKYNDLTYIGIFNSGL